MKSRWIGAILQPIQYNNLNISNNTPDGKASQQYVYTKPWNCFMLGSILDLVLNVASSTLFESNSKCGDDDPGLRMM